MRSNCEFHTHVVALVERPKARGPPGPGGTRNTRVPSNSADRSGGENIPKLSLRVAEREAVRGRPLGAHRKLVIEILSIAAKTGYLLLIPLHLDGGEQEARWEAARRSWQVSLCTVCKPPVSKLPVPALVFVGIKDSGPPHGVWGPRHQA